jgi:hypothetical protein
MRLTQYLGVANVTTNGSCAVSAPSIEVRSRARSGGTRVVSSPTRPWLLASVGVRDGYAREPTGGEAERRCTRRSPRAAMCALPPSGRATSWYFPAAGTRTCAT